MKALGRHLLFEFHGCDVAAISSLEVVRETLVSAARIAGATVVEVAFHEFSPHGVSGVVIIAESHFSIHTWPEHRYAAIDIFTCGGTLDVGVAVERCRRCFKPRQHSSVEVKRGVLFAVPARPPRPEPKTAPAHPRLLSRAPEWSALRRRV